MLTCFLEGCQKDKSKKSGEEGDPTDSQGSGDQGGAPELNQADPDALEGREKSQLAPKVVGEQGANQVEKVYFTEPYRQEMLSPEQFSRFLSKTFGFTKKEVRSNLVTDDWLLIYYRIPLGGVDFKNVFVRKNDIDPQKILAMRDMTFRYLTSLVQEDQETIKKKGSPRYFNLADPSLDRPFTENDLKSRQETQAKIKSGEARWKAQWEDFYRKFFKRNLTPEELGLLKSAFTEITTLQKGNPAYAWILTLSAVLMSQEAWTI